MKQEIDSQAMGCVLVLLSFVGVSFFGVMEIGALLPSLAFYGFVVSALALFSSLVLLILQSIYWQWRRPSEKLDDTEDE